MSNEWIELAKKDYVQEKDGYTAMHRASVEGDGKVIHFVGKLDPESCLVVEDKGLSAPLHRAAVNGDAGAIKEIACPESLAKLTSKDETALDVDGSYSDIIQINSKNNQGQTALDICSANSEDSVSNEIGSILERAAARQQTACAPELPTDTTSGCWNFARFPIETKNVILMVLGLIATAFFTVTCDLPNAFVKGNHPPGQKFDAKDVISGKLPTVVYLMIFNSAGFMTTMAAITIVIWPLQLRTILLFLVICTCVVYVMLVDEITPKFSVSVGKSSISSIALMWSLVAALSLSGISILSMWGKFTSPLWQFIVWLSMKRANCWSNNTLEDLEAGSI